jgi:hypothetical protein
MAKTNNKKAEAAAAKAKKGLKARHVAYVCADIESHRNSKGKIPWGIMQKVFNEHKEVVPWLTIDLVKKGLKKRKENKTQDNNKDTSTMSDLTNPTFDGSNQESNQPDAPPPRNIAVSLEPELPPETSKSKGGRPRGTTLRASMEKRSQERGLNERNCNDLERKGRRSEVGKKRKKEKKRA